MAGDWIKTEHALPDKPEVWQIGSALGLSAEDVVGRLIRVWVWADQNLSPKCPRISGTESGLMSLIDGTARRPGFAAAMISAGWLLVENGQLSFPNYDKHLSQSAKSRAVESQKKRNQRAKSRDTCPDDVPEVSPESGDKIGTKSGPEKRREEKREDSSKEESSKSTEVEKLADLPAWPCNGPVESWSLPQSKLDEWRESFPGIDVASELRKSLQWCRDNVKKRKTAGGMLKFLNAWLAKANDQPRTSTASAPVKKTVRLCNSKSLNAEEQHLWNTDPAWRAALRAECGMDPE